MNNIWAPWRMKYIARPKDSGCFFCEAPINEDPLVLIKLEHCFAIMNRFPYTSGHCMVAPYDHVGDLAGVGDAQFTEIMSLVKRITASIRSSMKPDGFNVGCNIGSVAGAGFADHIHIHIVPRWNGDTNFMPVLGDVHLISEHIEETRDKIMRTLS